MMSFSFWDWLIFAALFAGLTLLSFAFRKSAKGVAHFLVAGRNVGRYLGLESDSMAGLGAITILGLWQVIYNSGFVGTLWYLLTPLAATVVALTGFGIYRFRQTRAMTLGQLVEMRYSRNARIFFGLSAYVAGVLNMGIFPSVGANFFVYYCGFPPHLFGIPINVLLMVLLVGAAAVIAFNGGQVTLVITNFAQALFVNLMLVAVMIVLYKLFTWNQVAEAFLSAPNADQLIHPFSEKATADFDKLFFLIGIFWMVYWVISWAPNSLVTSSARDAHEAKMMRVMVEIKKLIYAGLGIGVLPLAAYVFLHHPDFAALADQVKETLATIDNEQVRNQMTTAAALKFILPKGLLGAFGGIILFAFMSTHTSYLLAWGGILIQDVIMPLRGKKLEPKTHILWIRLSLVFVAVFIVSFSILFPQNDHIINFLDLTGSIYLAGAGVVLLGGLYWRRATTAGAWAAMITGASLSIVGFIGKMLLPDLMGGRVMSFYVTLISIAAYVVVSLLTREKEVDLNRILNRDAAEVEERRLRKWFRFGPEVPRGDRILIVTIFIVIGLFALAFVGGWLYYSRVSVPLSFWMDFWHDFIYGMFVIGTLFLSWIIFGGFRDLFRLFKGLKTQKVDIRDDGSVTDRNG